MWPFKNKEEIRQPMSWIDYTLLGVIHGKQLKERMRRDLGRPPKYTQSKIIQPKQLK